MSCVFPTILCFTAAVLSMFCRPVNAKDVAPALHAEKIAPPAGYLPSGPQIDGNLTRGRTTRVPLSIDTAGCYRVTATAGKGAEDITLALFRSGKEIARDRLSGKSPSVDWCAAEASELEVEISMYAGQGPFAVAVFKKKNESGATPVKHNKAGGKETDYIANRIRQLAPRFAKGQRPISDVLRGEVTAPGQLSIPVALNGKCISLVAAQAPALIELSVYLENADGLRIAGRLNATASYTTFVPDTCPPKGAYRIIIVSIRGGGAVGVQIFSD